MYGRVARYFMTKDTDSYAARIIIHTLYIIHS